MTNPVDEGADFWHDPRLDPLEFSGTDEAGASSGIFQFSTDKGGQYSAAADSHDHDHAQGQPLGHHWGAGNDSGNKLVFPGGYDHANLSRESPLGQCQS